MEILDTRDWKVIGYDQNFMNIPGWIVQSRKYVNEFRKYPNVEITDLKRGSRKVFSESGKVTLKALKIRSV